MYVIFSIAKYNQIVELFGVFILINNEVFEMFNKEIISSYFNYGVIYACGCNDCKKQRNENGKLTAIPKKICFGWTGEHTEMYTLRSLKAIKQGLAGKEWQDLLAKYPNGSVDYFFELYYCDTCGYWANEENLSFYLPKNERAKYKTVRWERNDIIEYKLYKKYHHKCPQCRKLMRKIESRDFFTHESTDLISELMLTEKTQLQLISEMHLVCPKCKKEILVLDRNGNEFYVYGVPDIRKTYDEWIECIKTNRT